MEMEIEMEMWVGMGMGMGMGMEMEVEIRRGVVWETDGDGDGDGDRGSTDRDGHGPVIDTIMVIYLFADPDRFLESHFFSGWENFALLLRCSSGCDVSDIV